MAPPLQVTSGPTNLDSAALPAISVVVRFAGLVVMGFGLFIGWQVVTAAWGLFESQERVTTFADEFEARSGLNGLFHSLLDQRLLSGSSPQLGAPNGPTTAQPAPTMLPPGAASNPAPGSAAPMNPREALAHTNVSYLSAWFFTLILLSLISRIAVLAIVSGGKLAMHQGPNLEEIRILARELARATRREQGGPVG